MLIGIIMDKYHCPEAAVAKFVQIVLKISHTDVVYRMSAQADIL